MKLKPGGKIALLLFAFGIAWIAWRQFGPRGVKESLNKIPVVGTVLGTGEETAGGGGGSGGDGVLGRPLKVALNYWPGFAGGVLANNGFPANKDCLFWKNHNLQVEFVNMEDPAQMTQALAAGAPSGVDVMWQTTDTWPANDANYRKQGIKAQAFLQADWSRGGDAIVVAPGIGRIEDLPGKRVGLITLSPSHSLLEEALRNSSLDESQRKQVRTSIKEFTDPQSIVQAFAANQLDAAVTWEPNASEALSRRSGSRILLDSSTASKIIGDIFVAKEEFIRENPAAIKAFCAGWLEGATEANRHPGQAVEVLMKSMPPYEGKEELTRRTMAKAHLTTLSDNNELFGLGGGGTPLFDRLYDRFARIYLDLGMIDRLPKVAEGKSTAALGELYQATPVPAPQPPEFRPPTPQQQAKPPVLTRRVAIRFTTGSAQVRPESAGSLNELVGLAERLADAYLRIEGNTDNVGSRDLNRRLSQQRAPAVANYLAERGFDPDRFIVRGNGPDRPIASNGSEAGRAKNRRTEVKVVPR